MATMPALTDFGRLGQPLMTSARSGSAVCFPELPENAPDSAPRDLFVLQIDTEFGLSPVPPITSCPTTTSEVAQWFPRIIHGQKQFYGTEACF
jgi:hypothetical protein